MYKTERKQGWFPEFTELNWRFWSFVLLLVMSLGALTWFPVIGTFEGYTDPFYSPTLLVIPLIAAFRLSCYAYRKDYYRHVFKHPQACAAGIREGKNGESRGYSGEKGFFALNNYHRYFLYVGLAILPFFYYDFAVSMFYQPGYFIFRLGSILLIVNALLLTLWTISCHAFRHIFVRGQLDCFSCSLGGKTMKKLYDGQSFLNRHHEEFAFISLIIVVGVDLYIRALIAGLPVDFTFLKLAI